MESGKFFGMRVENFMEKLKIGFIGLGQRGAAYGILTSNCLRLMQKGIVVQ